MQHFECRPDRIDDYFKRQKMSEKMVQLRLLIACIEGSAIGWVYLTYIHPSLGGMSGGDFVLERGYAIEIIFWSIPIVIFLNTITTAAIIPTSVKETFKLSLLNALACLIPIPIYQYFAKAPGVYGESVFSFFILGNALIAIVVITLVAFLIAGISYCLINFGVNPLFIKLLRQKRH
jgi:hypothetical protein